MRRKTCYGKLLNAALSVFSSKGYTSSSVSDIIEKASVARGTFYLYFNSKRNAFEQVLDHVIGEIESCVPPSDPDVPFPDYHSVYQRMFSSYASFLDVFHRNRQFADIVFTEAIGLDKGFDRQIQKHYNTHRKRIRRFLRRVQNSGLARRFDVNVVIETIIGYTQRCAQVFLGRNGRCISVEKLARDLADIEFSIVCNAPLSTVRGGKKRVQEKNVAVPAMVRLNRRKRNA